VVHLHAHVAACIKRHLASPSPGVQFLVLPATDYKLHLEKYKTRLYCSCTCTVPIYLPLLPPCNAEYVHMPEILIRLAKCNYMYYSLDYMYSPSQVWRNHAGNFALGPNGLLVAATVCCASRCTSSVQANSLPHSMSDRLQ